MFSGRVALLNRDDSTWVFLCLIKFRFLSFSLGASSCPHDRDVKVQLVLLQEASLSVQANKTYEDEMEA